ncbi:MAG: hypothetical protein AAFO04_18830 [Cyanobacteria bacterium J06592_8]
MIGIIGQILGFNKKSDYFLEFDEAKGSDSAQTQPAPVAQPAPVEMTVAPAAPQAEAVETTVQEKAPAPEKKAKKTRKAKTAETAEVQEQAPAVAQAAPAPQKELPSFNQGLEATPAGMTFATDYLMKPSSASRRRPGPSMGMFKDMARQVGRR